MSPYPSRNMLRSRARLVLLRRVYRHNPARMPPTMHCAPEQHAEGFFFYHCCHLATCFRMYSRVASLLWRSYACTQLQRRRCKKIQFVALLRCLPPHCAPNYMCVQKKQVRHPACRGIIVAAVSLLCCASHYERQSITLQATCSGSWRCGARNGRLTAE